MPILRVSVVALVATGALGTVAACTSTAHPVPSPTVSVPAAASSSIGVTAPLLPGYSPPSNAAPWSRAYAATQFQDLLGAFGSASGGSSITSSSSFADYVQYSQQIAGACDPFLNGLRQGNWPVNAQTTIVAYTRLQQVVCDVELARGQAGNVQEYQGVQPPPAGTDSQLLDLRVKIYALLGI